MDLECREQHLGNNSPVSMFGIVFGFSDEAIILVEAYDP